MSRPPPTIPTCVIKEQISNTRRYRLVCLYCGKPPTSGGKAIGGKYAHQKCHQRASSPTTTVTARSIRDDQIRELLEAKLIDGTLFHLATRPQLPNDKEARDRMRSNARARCAAILNERPRKEQGACE